MTIPQESLFRQKALELNCLVPIEGLIPLLQEIRQNKLYCGCVTNACKANAEFLLKIINVRGVFFSFMRDKTTPAS
jgi:beta-phosphoglucomutase-like phosphatase (HAD superfamily)